MWPWLKVEYVSLAEYIVFGATEKKKIYVG